MERLLEQHIIQDLKKKIIFFTGSRQVGKTWLTQRIARSVPDSVFLDYARDSSSHFSWPPGPGQNRSV
jgi:hypothetical protein